MDQPAAFGQEVEIIDLTNSPPVFDAVDLDSDADVELEVQTLPVIPNTEEEGGDKKDSACVRGEKRRRKSKDAGAQSSGKSEGRVKRKRRDRSPSIQPRDQRYKSIKDTTNTETTSAPPKRRSSQPPQPPPSDDLFFVDVEPTIVSAAVPPIETSKEQDENKLLLPAHVSVFGTAPVEIISQPKANANEDDFIQFLDYDDPKEMVRYYDTPATKSHSRSVCKHCGAAGEHKTSQCPVTICLTCGARDEHPTRSCPISKVCFTCGMKGHINATCPNRRSSRTQSSSRQSVCERCYSSIHKTNECPTWWRLYAYLSDGGKTTVISLRMDRKRLKLGEGGEGYVASDEWCYNCGNCGHWGDDCTDAQRFDHPEGPSAFSSSNVATGPFYDPEEELRFSASNRRDSRRQESFLQIHNVPDDVGRQAKEKSMAKLSKIVKQREMEDDPDDWFGKNRRTNDRQSDRNPQPKNTKIVFGQSFRDKPHLQASTATSVPSLLSRLGDEYTNRESRNRRSDPGDAPPLSKSRRKNHRRQENGSHRQDGVERADTQSNSQSSRNKNDRRNDSGYARESQSSRNNGYGGGYRSRTEPSGPRYKGGYGR